MENEQQNTTPPIPPVEPENSPKSDYNPIQQGITELSKSVQLFIQNKYAHDKSGLWVHFGIVVTILVGIIILSCKLDNAIIGTLLGSLIGFAFGNFPKNGGGKQST